MGARRTAIAPIAHPKQRRVTFAKRKNGIMKKAWELAVLCQAEALVVLRDARGRLFIFSASYAPPTSMSLPASGNSNSSSSSAGSLAAAAAAALSSPYQLHHHQYQQPPMSPSAAGDHPPSMYMGTGAGAAAQSSSSTSPMGSPTFPSVHVVKSREPTQLAPRDHDGTYDEWVRRIAEGRAGPVVEMRTPRYYDKGNPVLTPASSALAVASTATGGSDDDDDEDESEHGLETDDDDHGSRGGARRRSSIASLGSLTDGESGGGAGLNPLEGFFTYGGSPGSANNAGGGAANSLGLSPRSPTLSPASGVSPATSARVKPATGAAGKKKKIGSLRRSLPGFRAPATNPPAGTPLSMSPTFDQASLSAEARLEAQYYAANGLEYPPTSAVSAPAATTTGAASPSSPGRGGVVRRQRTLSSHSDTGPATKRQRTDASAAAATPPAGYPSPHAAGAHLGSVSPMMAMSADPYRKDPSRSPFHHAATGFASPSHHAGAAPDFTSPDFTSPQVVGPIPRFPSADILSPVHRNPSPWTGPTVVTSGYLSPLLMATGDASSGMYGQQQQHHQLQHHHQPMMTSMAGSNPGNGSNNNTMGSMMLTMSPMLLPTNPNHAPALTITGPTSSSSYDGGQPLFAGSNDGTLNETTSSMLSSLGSFGGGGSSSTATSMAPHVMSINTTMSNGGVGGMMVHHGDMSTTPAFGPHSPFLYSTASVPPMLHGHHPYMAAGSTSAAPSPFTMPASPLITAEAVAAAMGTPLSGAVSTGGGGTGSTLTMHPSPFLPPSAVPTGDMYANTYAMQQQQHHHHHQQSPYMSAAMHPPPLLDTYLTSALTTPTAMSFATSTPISQQQQQQHAFVLAAPSDFLGGGGDAASFVLPPNPQLLLPQQQHQQLSVPPSVSPGPTPPPPPRAPAAPSESDWVADAAAASFALVGSPAMAPVPVSSEDSAASALDQSGGATSTAMPSGGMGSLSDWTAQFGGRT